VIEFTLQHVNHEGILGVDVAMNSEGKLRIIEANRAPSWQIFEQATGINVAEIIINQAVKRLEQ
jgi:glutathione synthase/RimK-type ligase-like ATP-grasp enzyme